MAKRASYKKLKELEKIENEVAHPPEPFSVLLQYPGGDTYYAWVWAHGAGAAVDAAKADWAKDHPEEELPDFTVLAVMKGHVDLELRREDFE